MVACAGGDEGVARVKRGTEDVGRSPIVVVAPEASTTPIFGSNLVLRSCLL